MITVRLNHIALDVADRDRSVAFYRDLLGTEVVAEDVEHRLTFLRLPGSPRYSDVALHAHPALAAAYPAGELRMAHVGWEVDDAAALVEAFDFFTRTTRVLLAADFGVSWSVMGMDPDGNVVELELPRTAPGSREQPGFGPLDVEALRATLTPA